MKKICKILIIVIVIIAFAIGAILAIGNLLGTLVANLLGGQIPTTAITADYFKTTMESKGFIIQDDTTQLTKYSHLEKAYIATKENCKFIFFEFLGDEHSVDFYNTNKIKFEEILKNEPSLLVNEATTTTENYMSSYITINNKYMHVSRIDNTAILIETDNNYKKEVQNIMKYLGYLEY